MRSNYRVRSEFTWKYNEVSFNGNSAQTQNFTTDFLIPNDGLSIFNGPFTAYAAIVYGIKFGFGDETTYDMIPVRFTNENCVSEGAMYDRVSGKLFRNQGTGTFIIGPDKNRMFEVLDLKHSKVHVNFTSTQNELEVAA